MKRKGIKQHKTGFMETLIANSYMFGFLLLLIVVGSLVSYMYIRNSLNLVSSTNILLKEDCARLEQENIFLESEINELKRPGHIRKTAQEELGMINSKPKPDAVILLKKHD